MDFRQLEVFVAVVQWGSFSKAANQLYLTQPTVSSQISSLEALLGVQLFLRGHRKTTLSAKGKTFYPYALDLLHLKERAEGELREGTSKGVLHLAASSIPGTYLLPAMLKGFSGRVMLAVSNTEQVVESLLDYRQELGFVGEGDTPASFQKEIVATCQMAVITPNTGPYAYLELDWQHLRKAPWILRAQGSATRNRFSALLKEQAIQMEELFIRVEMDSVEGTKALVKQGLGVSFVPMISLEEEEGIKVFPVSCGREFYLLYNPKRILSQNALEFLRYVKEGWCKHEPDLSG